MELTNLKGENIVEWVLLGLFVCSFLIQLFYLLYFYLRLLRVKPLDKASGENPITILLCVRNEEERIVKVLESIREQMYGSFEVVVVDDFSEDRTLEIIGSFAEKYGHIRFTSLGQETRFSEKISRNLGLKACRSDWVLLLPNSLEQIAPEALLGFNDCFSDDDEAVIGYSNYTIAGGAANRLVRLERFYGFLRSASYSLVGLPFTFSEYNICFRKTLYFAHDGFRGMLNQGHANLELIFNQHLKKASVSTFKKTIVHEAEPLGRQDYIQLVKKELLLRRALRFKKRFVLFLEDFSRIFFHISFMLLLIIKPGIWVFLIVMFLILSLFLLIIVKKNADRLNEPKIFISSFIYILIKPLINFYQTIIMYIQERRSKWS